MKTQKMCRKSPRPLRLRTFLLQYPTQPAMLVPVEITDENKKVVVTRSVTTTLSGCGGRTRTYDLRVMSPTSFQLLYSAILRGVAWLLVNYSMGEGVCQGVFSVVSWEVQPLFGFLWRGAWGRPSDGTVRWGYLTIGLLVLIIVSTASPGESGGIHFRK